MKRRIAKRCVIVITYLILAIMLDVSLSFKNAQGNQCPYDVLGFLPYWVRNYYPKYEYLTHIAWFSVDLNADGSLTNSFGWPPSALINEAHTKGVKVVLTAKCFDKDTIDSILAYRANDASANLLSLIRSGNGDGVMIDFEGIRQINKFTGENNAVLLVQFMQVLSNLLKKADLGYYVSICTPAVDWSRVFNCSGISSYVDSFFIMAYDYHWQSGDTAGAVSPLKGDAYNVTQSVDDYISLANSKKFILGNPLVGYDWPTETGNIGSKTLGSASAWYINTAIKNAETYGYIWDENTKTPWYKISPDKSKDGKWHQCWFDDPTSLGLKYKLALQKELKGIGFWALGYEEGSSDIYTAWTDMCGGVTRFMDFEDGTDGAVIRSKIPGMAFTSTEGYDWIYSDIRTGKYSYPLYWVNGNFCAWLGPSQGVGRINFTSATAKTVSLSYSGYYRVYLEAYDASGNLLSSVSGPPNIGTLKMDRLSVSGLNIAYVLIHDSGNFWIIDDLEVGDLLAETEVSLPTDFVARLEEIDTINQVQPKWKIFVNEIWQTIRIILGWGGSQLSIRVYRPDGSLYDEHQSDMSPIIINIPQAEPGKWQFEITPMDVPYDNYPFALVIGTPQEVKLYGGAYFYPENPTYRASFSMDVVGPSSPSGWLKYYYTRTRMNFVSTGITSVSISGNIATITGNGTVNGVGGYTFTATVNNGTPDNFYIVIRKADGSTYYSAGPRNISGGDLAIQ